MLPAVLNGYLGVRRLIIHRTRLIDDAEKKLLALLELLTCGEYYVNIIENDEMSVNVKVLKKKQNNLL